MHICFLFAKEAATCQQLKLCKVFKDKLCLIALKNKVGLIESTPYQAQHDGEGYFSVALLLLLPSLLFLLELA